MFAVSLRTDGRGQVLYLLTSSMHSSAVCSIPLQSRELYPGTGCQR